MAGRTGSRRRETELSAEEISGLRAPEEAMAPEFRLRRDENVRTKQVIRALESGNFEGITFPGPRGTRREFSEQFSEEELNLLQRAWIVANPDERRLFADELNVFFEHAGTGVVGMLTLAKVLGRMAKDYLDRAGPYAESRLFSLADFYYYAIDIMAEETQEGTRAARGREIGGLGRRMARAGIGRKYDRLIESLREERRAAIIRTIPELEAAAPAREAVPTLAEEAAPTEEVAAPAEEATAAAVPIRARYDYLWLKGEIGAVIRILGETGMIDPARPDLRVLGNPAIVSDPEVGEQIRRRYVNILTHIGEVRDLERQAEINNYLRYVRRAMGISEEGAVPAPAPEARVAEAEIVPVAPPVEAPPAEAAAPRTVAAFAYGDFRSRGDRVAALLGDRYDPRDPAIFDIPESGEEIRGIYEDVRAHFTDLDALLAQPTLTDVQRNFLLGLKRVVEEALG